MGKPYSQDLRERVMGAVDEGERVYALAPLFRVSVSYIYKALGRRRETGETTARTGRAGRKPKLAAHDAALGAHVAAHADATLEEIRAWLAADRNITVSIGCLWNRLEFLGLPLKKSHNARPSRIGRMLPRRARSGAPRRPN